MTHGWNRAKLALLAVAALAGGAIAACGGALGGETPAPTSPGGISAPEVEDRAIAELPLDDAALEDSLASSVEVEVDFGRFRQLIARDVIAPIYDPTFISGELAELDPGELVMGVEINGESRAYPIGPLNYREMVNDVVGGVPILVTW